MKLVDAHCHLDLKAAQALLQTLDAGGALPFYKAAACVYKAQDLSALKALFQGDARLCGLLNNALCVGVGYHPAFLNGDENLETLESFLNAFKSAFIGEIGLDYVCETPHETQRAVFLNQLELALQNGLGAVLHIVKAHAETIDILKGIFGVKGGMKLCIHASRFSKDIAREYLKLNAFLSVGLRELKGEKGLELAKYIPLENILFESDSSLGEAGALAVCEEFAKLSGIGAEICAEAANRNFSKMFLNES